MRRKSIVRVPADGLQLEGEIFFPEDCRPIVVFAHGSGSSRHSPRNKFVAEELQGRGIGTLLFDHLSEKEDKVYETRFDIDLLTRRLLAATDWLRSRPETKWLDIGYFGASTGVAAAINAASGQGDKIFAV